MNTQEAPAAPSRVTATMILEKIKNVEYLYHDTLTICILTLQNGFIVTGESACADPTLYNKATGEHYAYIAASEKVWPLEGYLLKERLHNGK